VNERVVPIFHVENADRTVEWYERLGGTTHE